MSQNISETPTLSNPRNRRSKVLVTKLIDLPVEIVNAMIAGKINLFPHLVFFDFNDEVRFLGTIEVSDIVHCPSKHEWCFHVASQPNPGSRFWRVVYEITAALVPGGDVTVTRIDVAPDDPNDDAEHAPPPSPA